MLIEDLVEGINLEDETNEFKGIIKEGINPKNNERYEIGWLKEIVGFSNSFGGKLYIGVDNKTHQVLALDHKEADSIVLMIHRLIKEHIEPSIKYKISKINVPDTKPTRYVLIISVERNRALPVALKFNNFSFYFVRHFGKTSPATNEEVQNLVLDSESISFDSPFTEIDFKKEDFTFLYDVFKKNNNRELTIKDLESIGFISLDKKLSKGSLLFKDDYHDNKTLVVCSQFLGNSKGDNTFFYTKEIKDNLLKEYYEILEFLDNRTANGFIKKIDKHVELISYPKRALTEGVVNALVHRNYFIGGSQIEINLFNNRLEIISPGSLVGSKWLKNEKDLASIPPLRRNEVICNVFYICKLMEKRGSGFDKIEEEYLPYDKKYRPYLNSNNLYFSLTLLDLTKKISDNELDNEIVKVYLDEDKINSKYDLDILGYCYYRKRSVKEIATYLKLTPSTYFRKNVIDKLVMNKYLIEFKDGVGSKYMTSKEFVKLDSDLS